MRAKTRKKKKVAAISFYEKYRNQIVIAAFVLFTIVMLLVMHPG